MAYNRRRRSSCIGRFSSAGRAVIDLGDGARACIIDRDCLHAASTVSDWLAGWLACWTFIISLTYYGGRQSLWAKIEMGFREGAEPADGDYASLSFQRY